MRKSTFVVLDDKSVNRVIASVRSRSGTSLMVGPRAIRHRAPRHAGPRCSVSEMKVAQRRFTDVTTHRADRALSYTRRIQTWGGTLPRATVLQTWEGKGQNERKKNVVRDPLVASELAYLLYVES